MRIVHLEKHYEHLQHATELTVSEFGSNRGFLISDGPSEPSGPRSALCVRREQRALRRDTGRCNG